MKHTPGPWEAIQLFPGSESWIVISKDHGVLPARERTAHYKESDACLIAAAPDMLQALKWCESWIVKHGLDKAETILKQDGKTVYTEVPILICIKAVIAKAEVRS